MHETHQKDAEATIRALAERFNISYNETATDVSVAQVTRLAGDDVTLDDVELLLIALQRAGHLSRPESLRLKVSYLRAKSHQQKSPIITH